jgi:hypothetical protein
MQTIDGFTSVTETSQCVYAVNFNSKAMCTAAASASGGITGDWAFVMVVLIGGFVYVAGGVIYKRQKLGVTVCARVSA